MAKWHTLGHVKTHYMFIVRQPNSTLSLDKAEFPQVNKLICTLFSFQTADTISSKSVKKENVNQ